MFDFFVLALFTADFGLLVEVFFAFCDVAVDALVAGVAAIFAAWGVNTDVQTHAPSTYDQDEPVTAFAYGSVSKTTAPVGSFIRARPSVLLSVRPVCGAKRAMYSPSLIDIA